jgi:hypothetical protein
VIRVVAVALSATVAASWIFVTLGDIASYRAWWHYLPMWIELTLLGSLLGWWLATRRRSPAPGYLRWVAAGVLALSCASVTAFAAAATWDRQSVVDADVAAARARAAGTSTGPVVWQSQSEADICDMERDWVQAAIAQWFGLKPGDFRVAIRDGRGAMPGVCG